MTAPSEVHFNRQYKTHLKHLRLKGLQPKTIEAESRAIRRIGKYFEHQLDDLSEAQLLEYFAELLESHSWSAVKLDLYGLKVFYTHVLRSPGYRSIWSSRPRASVCQTSSPLRRSKT